MLRWFKRRSSKTDMTVAPRPAPLEIPHDKIAARAAEIWDRKGRPHGQDEQNWAEAEAELRVEYAAQPDSEPLPNKPR